MIQRIMGVFKLDVNTFEEVEHDESATGQAAIVVAVIAIVAAISNAISAVIGGQAAADLFENLGTVEGLEDFGPLATQITQEISPVGSAIQAFIGVFIAWLLWSALTYFIGTSLFSGKATMGEMLRVLGFAMSPRLLSVFTFIPCLGPLVALVGWVWSLVAGFIAVRQGLDLDNGKAAATIGVSFIAVVFVQLCVLGPIFAFLPF